MAESSTSLPPHIQARVNKLRYTLAEKSAIAHKRFITAKMRAESGHAYAAREMPEAAFSE